MHHSVINDHRRQFGGVFQDPVARGEGVEVGVEHAHNPDLVEGPRFVDPDPVLSCLEDAIAHALLSCEVHKVGVLALQALVLVALVAVRVLEVAPTALLVNGVKVVVEVAFGAGEGRLNQALSALGIQLSADLGIARRFDVCAVPAWLALAGECVFAVAVSAAILAERHVACSALPTAVAHAEVRSHSDPVKA